MTPQQQSLLDASTAEVAASVTEDRPGAVQRDHPETARAAAAAVKTGTQRHQALQALHEGPKTAHEVAAWANYPRPHVFATRLLELRTEGCVVCTAETRPTWSGQAAMVWAVTPLGRAVVEELT